MASDPFFTRQREQIVGLAARYAIPAIYQWRKFISVGGLMSYGTATKVELLFNMKTARTLGLLPRTSE